VRLLDCSAFSFSLFSFFFFLTCFGLVVFALLGQETATAATTAMVMISWTANGYDYVCFHVNIVLQDTRQLISNYGCRRGKGRRERETSNERGNLSATLL